MKNVNTGLTPEATKKLKEIIGVYLADLHILAAKTKAFHWNIEDVNFFSLHEKLDEHYDALQESIDDSAERIRAVGEKSPVTLKHYLEVTQLSESEDDMNAQEMFTSLLNDYETIIRYLRAHITVAVEECGDEATGDFFIGELAKYEKTAWMIRSMVS